MIVATMAALWCSYIYAVDSRQTFIICLSNDDCRLKSITMNNYIILERKVPSSSPILVIKQSILYLWFFFPSTDSTNGSDDSSANGRQCANSPKHADDIEKDRRKSWTECGGVVIATHRGDHHQSGLYANQTGHRECVANNASCDK